jgi:hypothetical protein
LAEGGLSGRAALNSKLTTAKKKKSKEKKKS